MKRICRRMFLTLREVKFTLLECERRRRIVDSLLARGLRQTGELGEELLAPFVNESSQFRLVIGEKKERTGGSELLPLKEHGRSWTQQKNRRQCAIPARAGQSARTQPGAGVGDLVMVLQEDDEGRRRDPRGRGAAPLLLPAIELSLIEKAAFGHGYKLLWQAEIIAQVGLAASRQRGVGAVVKIVIPDAVEAVSALFQRPHQLDFLWLVFGHHDRRSSVGGFANALADGRQNRLGGAVVDVLRRVQA